MEHITDKVAQGYQVTKNVNRCVFTGDTIFVGGCGRFFEGEPHEMAAAMTVARDVLPADTKMFCGHEYTVANLNFCAIADPTNEKVLAKRSEAIASREASVWTVPTKLSDEREFNVFMRCFDADMQTLTGTSNPTDCIGFLRQWKNSGNKPQL